MIELPEALTIARQMNETIGGKRIASGTRGNAPHKFAFYTREPEEYEAIFRSRTIGEAREHGSQILVPIEEDYVLVLGGGGERILFHESAATLPRKHQLSLSFEDGTHLSVSVQGWGCCQLLTGPELAENRETRPKGPSPLSDEFSYDYFRGLFAAIPEGDPRSAKYFVISQPGIWGVGNGYLQDILFRAGIHPRRRALQISEGKQRLLYEATKLTLRQAADLGGRDSERDLFNRPGGYRRILTSEATGRPCPECGTAIEKISFLGGASYFCPKCQG